MKSKFSKERRDVLKSLGIVAGAAALGTVGGSMKAFAAGGAGDYPQPPGSPKTHDTFVFSEGPNKGQEVKLADIVLDAPPVAVQAKDSKTGEVRDSEHSEVLLFRVKKDTIPIEYRSDSAEGILAYSALCTKDATLIKPKDFDPASKQVTCSTCKTQYDLVNGAEVKGGPGKRALPQVPVGDDFDKPGYLFITHGIIGWIGIKRR
jgi:rieske iron-sulfur protein